MEDIRTGILMPELYCFLRVGYFLSFTKASEELFITQSAVSHRIRKLEQYLGFSLFERLSRQLTFTENGSRFYSIIKKNIGEIETEIRNISTQNLQGYLNISSIPSFASCWLNPRLISFSKRFNSIILNLRTRFDLVDFQTESIDIAIYFGDGNYSGLDVVKLMNEEYIPVCSSTYADEHDLWDNPEALKKCVLLHDSIPWPTAQYYSEWKAWAAYFGLDIDCNSGYSFDRSELIFEAASLGMGIALGRKRMISKKLASGELVVPFDMFLLSSQSYYVVSTKERANTSRVAAFRKWLLEQAENNV